MKRVLSWLLVLVGVAGCGVAERPVVTPAVTLVIPTPQERATEPAAPPVVVANAEGMLAAGVTAVFPTRAVDPAFGGESSGSGSAVVSGVVGEVSGIVEPLLIDGERGRMYAQAEVDGQPQTVVLSTVDGQLLGRYEESGRLALDRAHNRLVVDQGEAGLVVLDAAEGRLLARVALPSMAAGQVAVAPQVDPDSGLIYAFRDRMVYVVHPVTGEIERAIELNVETIVCGQPGDPAGITGSQYDLINGKLYLTFITYVCTPWVGVSIVAYEAATMMEVGRQGAEIRYQAVAFGDNLYGTSVSRLGPASYWAWNENGAWYQEGTGAYVGDPAGMVADWGRQLVYEAIGTRVRIVRPGTRSLVNEVEVALLANEGRLVGHDPVSDNLYFLDGDGRVVVWPAGNLFGD